MKTRIVPAGPRLASVAELESPAFTAFMAELNAFAAQHALREFRDWSKVWEYPWLWLQGLGEVPWSEVHLVDLGSEISAFPWWLAATRGTRVTLIETDPQWIPKWVELKTALSVDVTWHIVSSEAIPLPDESVDVLTSFSVIEHQPNKCAAVSEAARILKDGGIFALSFDICEAALGMTFPAWNGRALTRAEYETEIAAHPAFSTGQPICWNLEDAEAFKAWHLRSGDHHNYVVGAALHRRARRAENRRLLFVRPDTFGDLILFEPALRAVRQALPEAKLGLLVRAGYETLAPLFPRQIEWLVTDCQPYRQFVPAADAPELVDLRAQIERFDPETVIAPCQNPTWLECVVALLTPGADHVALGTRRLDLEILRSLAQAGLPNAPQDAAELAALFPRCLELPAVTPELEKNRALASALTDRAEAASPPFLEIPASVRSWAERELAQRGFEAGHFLACCPAGTANIAIKAWPAEAYGEVLAWAERTRGLPALLLGSAEERPRLEAVRAHAMARGASRTAILIGGEGGFVEVVGVLAQARAYLGNDTGALHAAAALGCPVTAVFGGGHWPSFRPAGQAAVVTVVQPLACFGCGWECPFGDAPCVQSIPSSAVREALDELLAEPRDSTRNWLHEVTAEPATAARLGAAAAVLRAVRAEATQRLAVILDQGRRLAALDAQQAAESRAHSAELAALHERLLESERDRKARLSVIQEQSVRLVEQERRELAAQAAQATAMADLHQRLSVNEADRNARLAAIRALEQRLGESESDRAARGSALHVLETRLQECEADRARRLGSMQELGAQLAESEADRRARLEVINRLNAQLAESEADRRARLEVINRQAAQLAESEADRAARLEVINRQAAQLAESEADRTGRLEMINVLGVQLAESEADRKARWKVIQGQEAQLAAGAAALSAVEGECAALRARAEKAEAEGARLASYVQGLESRAAFRALRGLKLVERRSEPH